jgi:hypothetical protein
MLERRFSLCVLLSIIAGAAGCVGGSALVRRDTAEVQLRSPATAIAWYGPAADGDAGERIGPG